MRLDIDKITPGMILAEDVIIPSGGILLHSPVQLTESHINTLKKRGIKKVLVETHNSSFSLPSLSTGNISEKTGTEPADTDESTPETPPVVETPPKPPKISVSVSLDLLSADIRVESNGYANEVLTQEDIISELMAHGIVYGINHFKIKELVSNWASVKRLYDIERIASGDEPSPGRQGQLDFKVNCISSRPQAEVIRSATYCYELIGTGIPIQRVDPGSVVAQRMLSTPPIPGKNIRGDEIPCDEIIKIEVKVDQIEIQEDDEVFAATTTGIPYFVEGVLGVIPISFDGTADIQVYPDRMKAELIIHPAIEGGNPPSEAVIRELFANHQIIYGIKENVLTNLLKNMSAGVFPKEPVLIAEGESPIDGENGSVEFLFNTESSLKPKVNPDGSVDYKNVELIHSICAGMPLARLQPAAKGTPGRDITGREIPGHDGISAVLPQGANTKISDDDAEILVAAIDGNISYNGSLIEVHEGFVVDGNVDYSTGNVKYEKSIIISGDIKSGFTVECGGDLQVHSTIEDSDVKVGGNLLCRYGFIGMGKGVVDVKGDVNITFMKNQTIRARGNVSIAKEALNCTILSRKVIAISGNPISVAGGTLMARDGIIIRTVGNASGIKSMLDAGTDFTLVEELQKTEVQLAEMTENCRKLIQTYRRYEQQLQIHKKLPPKDEFIYTKLRNTLAQYNKAIKTLESRKVLISQKLYDFDRAYIKIEYSAMPGTIFKFGERQHLVREPIIGPKSVRLIRGEIKIL